MTLGDTRKCPLCGDYWEPATMWYPGSCCACNAEDIDDALDASYSDYIDREIDELELEGDDSE